MKYEVLSSCGSRLYIQLDASRSAALAFHSIIMAIPRFTQSLWGEEGRMVWSKQTDKDSSLPDSHN